MKIRNLILILAILVLAMSTLTAEHRPRRDRSDRYFFRPSRTVFFVNPHLYPPIAASRYHGHYRGYGPYRGRYHSANHPSYRGYDRNYGSRNGVYRLIVPSPAGGGEVVRANSSDLIFQVEPPQALVYIDGKLIGSAQDFDTQRERFMLLAGEHDLRIEYPGYVPFQTRMDIQADKTLHLDIELESAPSPALPRR